MKMFLDSRKTFGTDHMLNTACIFCSYFRIDTQRDQSFGKQLMPLVDHFCDGTSFVCQIYKSGVCDRDLTFSRRFFMAILTLDFLKPSSLAMSTERTTGSFYLILK